MSQIPDSRFLHARGGMDITGIRQRMEWGGSLASFDYPAEEPNEPDLSGHGGPRRPPGLHNLPCDTRRRHRGGEFSDPQAPTTQERRLQLLLAEATRSAWMSPAF